MYGESTDKYKVRLMKSGRQRIIKKAAEMYATNDILKNEIANVLAESDFGHLNSRFGFGRFFEKLVEAENKVRCVLPSNESKMDKMASEYVLRWMYKGLPPILSIETNDDETIIKTKFDNYSVPDLLRTSIDGEARTISINFVGEIKSNLGSFLNKKPRQLHLIDISLTEVCADESRFNYGLKDGIFISPGERDRLLYLQDVFGEYRIVYDSVQCPKSLIVPSGTIQFCDLLKRSGVKDFIPSRWDIFESVFSYFEVMELFNAATNGRADYPTLETLQRETFNGYSRIVSMNGIKNRYIEYIHRLGPINFFPFLDKERRELVEGGGLMPFFVTAQFYKGLVKGNIVEFRH